MNINVNYDLQIKTFRIAYYSEIIGSILRSLIEVITYLQGERQKTYDRL